MGGDPAEEILSARWSHLELILIVMASHRARRGRAQFVWQRRRSRRADNFDPGRDRKGRSKLDGDGIAAAAAYLCPVRWSKLAATAFPAAGEHRFTAQFAGSHRSRDQSSRGALARRSRRRSDPSDVYEETVVAATKQAGASLDAAVAQLVAAGVRADTLSPRASQPPRF